MNETIFGDNVSRIQFLDLSKNARFKSVTFNKSVQLSLTTLDLDQTSTELIESISFQYLNVLKHLNLGQNVISEGLHRKLH